MKGFGPGRPARPRRGRRHMAAAGLAGAWAALGCAVPAAAERSLITVIDNPRIDSIVEVDRTANLQTGRGSAGSDHDGGVVLATGLLGVPATGPEAEGET
ncbi:hypothetical protein PUR61_04360 [Streptomyces sp. BE20]|uniref:hypothetical protein n=1 Tax=unclassified Streptomyces TaxID=2593676 RepID=UPI002E78EDFB|nr:MULTISPECIES: hypothetical protein [unclassified Streptomyces]MED7952031.1 hypothetical protein [Streptomyces sp. BE303]MEE1821435.1 hypothetical protein [Streptomyces sp. BE20]